MIALGRTPFQAVQVYRTAHSDKHAQPPTILVLVMPGSARKLVSQGTACMSPEIFYRPALRDHVYHRSNRSITLKSSLRVFAWTLPSFMAPSGRYQTFVLSTVSSCTKMPLGLASRFHPVFFHTCIAIGTFNDVAAHSHWLRCHSCGQYHWENAPDCYIKYIRVLCFILILLGLILSVISDALHAP